MRLRLLLLAITVAVAVFSCGGSSSETPWPVEPPQSTVDPLTEGATPPTVVELRPDGGAGARPKK